MDTPNGHAQLNVDINYKAGEVKSFKNLICLIYSFKL